MFDSGTGPKKQRGERAPSLYKAIDIIAKCWQDHYNGSSVYKVFDAQSFKAREDLTRVFGSVMLFIFKHIHEGISVQAQLHEEWKISELPWILCKGISLRTMYVYAKIPGQVRMRPSIVFWITLRCKKEQPRRRDTLQKRQIFTRHFKLRVLLVNLKKIILTSSWCEVGLRQPYILMTKFSRPSSMLLGFSLRQKVCLNVFFFRGLIAINRNQDISCGKQDRRKSSDRLTSKNK